MASSDMPRRVIIHAGFHKTGTTSLQQALRSNRPALKPYIRSLMRGTMTDVVHAARGFSTWRDPISFEKFGRRFHALLSGVGDMPRRTLCLSAEELSGHLPGRGALSDYSAAPLLAAEMARIIREIAPGADLQFFYSTRAPEPWLRSAYWEHVKSSSLTLDWPDYAQTYAGSANLDLIVDRIVDTVPHKVHRARLEDHARDPIGPAAALLPLCGVPDDLIRDLPPVKRANERHDDAVLLALLAANRDYADRDARKAAKAAILTAAQKAEP
jgi:hypothetical protein